MTPTTTYQPVETNHLLHLILTLATCGFWAPVWVLLAIVNHGRTRRVESYSPYVGQYRPEYAPRPYEVGPGAPVSALNPAPVAPPGVPPQIGGTGPLRPAGVGQFVTHPVPQVGLCPHGAPHGIPINGQVVWCNRCASVGR